MHTLFTFIKNLEIFRSISFFLHCRIGLSNCRRISSHYGRNTRLHGPGELHRHIHIVEQRTGEISGRSVNRLDLAGQTSVKRSRLCIGHAVRQNPGLLQLSHREQKRQIFLTGIGMGGPEQRTLEAERVLRQAVAAAGAPRMLESAGELLKGKPVYAGYGSEGILDWFEKHPELASLAVVYSGDPGFYSGAEGFRREAKRREAAGGGAFDVRTVAGISSMAFLCARMGISWQQVYPASRHGREADTAALLRDHAQVFLLLEGGDGAAQVCRQLTEAGYGDARVTVGERLSYPEERVVTAAASQMGETRFDGLCAMLIRR